MTADLRHLQQTAGNRAVAGRLAVQKSAATHAAATGVAGRQAAAAPHVVGGLVAAGQVAVQRQRRRSRVSVLEDRVGQLERANARLHKRQQAMDIDTEFAESGRRVHADWEAGISRLHGGYAVAYSRYQTALSDAAAARVFWATVAAGVLNVAAAVVMERFLLTLGAHSADIPPNIGLLRRLTYVEGAENPANAVVGAVTSSAAQAYGDSGGAWRPAAPARPPAAEGGAQPSAGPDVSDPFALYAFAHERVARSQSEMAHAFERQARERNDPAHEHDDYWDRFDPAAYRQRLQEWHTRALEVPGGSRFHTENFISDTLERAMWARWLPSHMEHRYVDRGGELRTSLDGPPRAIGARLDALGVTDVAGVNSLAGWWFVSEGNLRNLRNWASSHQPPSLYT
ncbi:hypothetical protein [Saccharothrix variisporea]|uniref:Uncharacterized protein n=1 Tax=Saccharothrix variisporea TaxID=543527 RepID=A0A495X9N5_9PSEU|nr:hypothetical protein [Saccharothrix variisporea]RKT69323.1 hypothetical protein DFJ66_2533 [Saccharothrix variisporea]